MLSLIPLHNSNPSPDGHSHDSQRGEETEKETAVQTEAQLLQALNEEIGALESEIRAMLQKRRGLMGWRKSLLPPRPHPHD